MKRILVATSYLLIMTSLILTTACQKQRTPFLQVDDSRDLLTISDYEGKDYPLQTQDSIHPAAAKGLKISDQRTEEQATVRNFDFVRYEAQDPLKLTDSTLMLGKNHHQYSLRYVFVGDLLKVMKVGAPTDLASDEIASAEKLSDGRLLVPIVSYKVTYYKIDHTRNDLNEPTAKLESVTVPTRSGATNFKIDYGSKTAATFLAKTTIFTSQLFTGEDGKDSDWYFSSTVLHMNYKDESKNDRIAYMQATDKYGRTATKVRARKIEDRIVFNNLSIDDRLAKTFNTNSGNQTAVVSVPVKLEDFRMKLQGQTSSVEEEAYTTKAWDKREYGDYDLKSVAIAGIKTSPIELIDVQLDDGYFSFTVRYDDGAAGSTTDGDGLTGLIRYSFLNVKNYEQSIVKQGGSAYKSKIYFPEDQDLFGVFATVQDYIHTLDRSDESTARNFVYINRYNPTRRQIEYRLNQDAPEWLEETVLQAEAAWNASLEQAGVQFRIHSSDNGKVLRGDLGDLRYSMVNFLGAMEGSDSWGGVAYSLVDPSTGEVVSATANVDLMDKLEGTKMYLVSWIHARMGLLEKKYIAGIPMSPSVNLVVDQTGHALTAISSNIKLAPHRLYRTFDKKTGLISKALPITNASAPKSVKKIHSLSERALDDDQFSIVHGEFEKVIANGCPNLGHWVDSLNGNLKAIYTPEGDKILNECLKEIVKPHLLQVVLHEMGHTLGLRHNFAGSTDKNNFYGPLQQVVAGHPFQIQWKSSTVMEYMPYTDDIMVQPGIYDTAAIRWAYTDKIETPTGQVLVTDPKQPSRPQVQNKARNYKYCTDENIDSIPVDPMCLRQDMGTTPTEIVKYLIESYNLSVADETQRLGADRISNMPSQAAYRRDSYMVPLTKFYEKWRLILSSQLGAGNDFLQKLQSSDEYQKAVHKVEDPSAVGAEQAALNTEYKQAADMIFQFFEQIAFLPDYACVTNPASEDPKALPQLVTFSLIQKSIFQQTGKTVQSCRDKEVINYVLHTRHLQIVDETGYSMHDKYANMGSVIIDQNSGDQIYRPETVGLAMDKLYATQALMRRSSELSNPAGVGTSPTFLDEFPYAQELQKKLFDRLLVGQSLSAIRNFVAPKGSTDDLGSTNFSAEKGILIETYSSFMQGLAIDGNPSLTTTRQSPYLAIPYNQINENERENVKCVDIEGQSYCAKPTSQQAVRLVQKLKQFEDLKKAIAITPEAVAKFNSICAKYVPAPGHGAELNFNTFDDLTNELAGVDDKDPLKSQIQYLADKVFDDENSIWTDGFDSYKDILNKMDISVAEATQRIHKYRETTIAQMAEKVAFSDDANRAHPAEDDHSNYLPLDMNILAQRVQSVVGAAQKIQDSRHDYELNAEEYDAQAEILTSIIANTSGN